MKLTPEPGNEFMTALLIVLGLLAFSLLIVLIWLGLTGQPG